MGTGSCCKVLSSQSAVLNHIQGGNSEAPIHTMSFSPRRQPLSGISRNVHRIREIVLSTQDDISTAGAIDEEQGDTDGSRTLLSEAICLCHSTPFADHVLTSMWRFDQLCQSSTEMNPTINLLPETHSFRCCVATKDIDRRWQGTVIHVDQRNRRLDPRLPQAHMRFVA